MSKIVLIENVEQLNYLLGLKTQVDCYDAVKGKNETISIWFHGKNEYTIFKHTVDIDREDSEEEVVISKDDLFDISKTNVGSVMNSKNLVLYSYMLDNIDWTKYNNFKNKGKK